MACPSSASASLCIGVSYRHVLQTSPKKILSEYMLAQLYLLLLHSAFNIKLSIFFEKVYSLEIFFALR